MTSNQKAVLLALCSTALMTATASLAKLAAHDYHVLQILFFRQIVILLSTLPLLVKDFPNALKTSHPGLHSLRLSGAFAALSLGILAVSGLPLTTSTTLGFANIFFVSLLAHQFLGERLGPFRLVAIVSGFIGVFIAIKPSPESFLDGFSLIALAAAFGASLAALSVRKLSQTESTTTLLSYQALFIGLLSGIPMIWLWRQPDLTDLILLLGMGCLSAAGNWIGIRALRLGEAGLVKSVDYISLIYAALFGYFIFGEYPDSSTLLGAGIIILAAFAIVQQRPIEKLLFSANRKMRRTDRCYKG